MINLEPSRIALILYILTLRRPKLLLLRFLGSGLIINFTAGLCSFLILPIFQFLTHFYANSVLLSLAGILLVLFGVFLVISSFSRSSGII